MLYRINYTYSNVMIVQMCLNLPPQFDFLLVSFQIHFAKNQTYLVSTQHASSVCATFVCFFGEIRQTIKLLNVQNGQTLIEVKMETLKTQEFHHHLKM